MSKKYLDAITNFIDDWDEYFKSYDIKRKLYEEDENFIYCTLEKLYVRTRIINYKLPDEIKIKKVPSLRSLLRDYIDDGVKLDKYNQDIYEPIKAIKYKIIVKN